jgi:phage antirepressor YoqD-like protein
MKNQSTSSHTTVMEKTMTVKEISDILGVTPEAIKKHVRELYPNFIKNGVETRLTDAQVTEIKQKMLPTTSVVGSVTDIERQKTIIRAFQYLKEDYESMKIKLEIAERKCIEQQPKADFYDSVTECKDAIDIGKVAKVLNIGLGRNRLFEILRHKGILQSGNIPYQKYIDTGYFRVIEQKYTAPDGITHINIKTLVYQRGVEFIRRTCAENRYLKTIQDNNRHEI